MRGKKVKFAAISAVFFLIFSVPVFGETDTASLTLTGTVGSLLEIIVLPTGDNLNLNLNRNAAVSKLLVARVQEISNSSSGYKVSVDSANGFELVSEGIGKTVTYTLFYNNSEVETDPAIVSDVTTKPSAVVEKDVEISYEVKGNIPKGTFEDVLTFTIEKN